MASHSLKKQGGEISDFPAAVGWEVEASPPPPLFGHLSLATTNFTSLFRVREPMREYSAPCSLCPQSGLLGRQGPEVGVALSHGPWEPLLF